MALKIEHEAPEKYSKYKNNFHDVSNYVWFDKNNEPRSTYFNEICHWRINKDRYSQKGNLLNIISRNSKTRTNMSPPKNWQKYREESAQYLEFLLGDDSPYFSSVLEKHHATLYPTNDDEDKRYYWGYLIENAGDAPLRPMFNLIVSVRNVWEYPEKVRLWYQLVNGDSGLSKREAFFVISFASLGEKDKITVNSLNYGHFQFDFYPHPNKVIEGSPTFDPKITSNNGDSYSPNNTMWGGTFISYVDFLILTDNKQEEKKGYCGYFKNLYKVVNELDNKQYPLELTITREKFDKFVERITNEHGK